MSIVKSVVCFFPRDVSRVRLDPSDWNGLHWEKLVYIPAASATIGHDSNNAVRSLEGDGHIIPGEISVLKSPCGHELSTRFRTGRGQKAAQEQDRSHRVRSLGLVR